MAPRSRCTGTWRPDRWVAQGRCGPAGSGRRREACVSLRLTVDDILLLHHLLLMLLQEAAVHRKAPRICRKVLLIHLKVTHQFVVDHFCTWASVQEPPQNAGLLSWALPWILSLPPFPGFSHQPRQHASPPWWGCSPSSIRDSTDRVRFRMLRESVDWERIRRSPRGDSSLKCLKEVEAIYITPTRAGGPFPGWAPKNSYSVFKFIFHIAVSSSEFMERSDALLPGPLFPKQKLTQQCWWWKHSWPKTRRSGHAVNLGGTAESCQKGRWRRLVALWWLL